MSPSSILGSNTSTNIAGRPGDRRGVVVRNPYTTNVVQTKSIQATLAALTKDTNALNDGAKQQETKHKSLLRELNDHFRPKYNQLVNDIRDARSSSGNHQQTMAHIKRERERLENQLKEEQRQLKDACETETKLIHSEETHKRKYVTDMRGLNKEFESLLKTQHDERSLSFLEAWLHQEKSGKLPFDNRCRQLLNKVLGEEASVLEDLERAFAEFQDTIKNIRQADEQIQGIRAQVLNHPATQATEGALTEASLLELERVWETNFSDEEEDDDHMQTDEGIMPVPNAPGHVHQGGSDLPVQQQLFYETTGGFSQEQSAP